MRDDDPVLRRGPLQQLRVFGALQFYFLSNHEIETRQAQLQPMYDSMIEVFVKQKATKRSRTRALSANHLVTPGQDPFAKGPRVQAALNEQPRLFRPPFAVTKVLFDNLGVVEVIENRAVDIAQRN